MLSMTGRYKLNIGVIIRLVLPYVLLIINGSVYGKKYYTNYWTFAYFLCLLLLHGKRIVYQSKKYYIMGHLRKHIILLSCVVLLVSLFNFNFSDTFLFIVLFATILIYTDMDNYMKELSISSNIMLLCSAFILIGFNTGRLLSQWNPNQIAMITVSSIYFFFISWEYAKHKILNFVLCVVTLYGVWKTESRAMVVGVLVAVFIICIFSKKVFLRNKSLIKLFIFTIAIIPFLVIVWNMLYLNTELSAVLNDFFLKYTSKTVYSGRESIWSQWIPIMLQPKYLLIGNGERIAGNLHSLIADVWYSYGSVTMLLYINMMFSTSKYIVYTFNDRIVRNSFASFCGMYIAQSFECMSSDTTYFYVFMYVFLGITIGRCITIYYGMENA